MYIWLINIYIQFATYINAVSIVIVGSLIYYYIYISCTLYIYFISQVYMYI